MVCFQDANGTAAQTRTARGKHYVLFDLPADKGLELKTKQPSLGWVTDINGHPALPFSIAARLILPVHIDRAPSGAEFGSLKEWLIDKDVMVKWWSKGQGGWFAASVVDYNADENKFKVSRIRSQIVLATTSLTRCVPRSDASSSMKLTALRSGESSLQRNIQRSLL